MIQFPTRAAAAAAALMAAPLALAHPEALHTADASFMAGLSHVFTGIDHLLAMLALGIWTATLARKHQFQISAALPVLLVLGQLLGMNWNLVAAADLAIGFSLLVLGGLLLRNTAMALPAAAIAVLSASFVTVHGMAHSEVLAGGSLISTFSIGLIAASLIAQQLGLMVDKLLQVSLPVILKGAGAVFSLAGLGLLGAQMVAG